MDEKPPPQIIDLFEAFKAALVVSSQPPKRPSARAEPQPRTWSYEDIRAAFERDREEL